MEPRSAPVVAIRVTGAVLWVFVAGEAELRVLRLPAAFTTADVIEGLAGLLPIARLVVLGEEDAEGIITVQNPHEVVAGQLDTRRLAEHFGCEVAVCQVSTAILRAYTISTHHTSAVIVIDDFDGQDEAGGAAEQPGVVSAITTYLVEDGDEGLIESHWVVCQDWLTRSPEQLWGYIVAFVDEHSEIAKVCLWSPHGLDLRRFTAPPHWDERTRRGVDIIVSLHGPTAFKGAILATA